MATCEICKVEFSGNGRLCSKNFCRTFFYKCMWKPKFFFEHVLIMEWVRGKPVYFKPDEWQTEVLKYIEYKVGHWKCPGCWERGLKQYNIHEDDVCGVCGNPNTHICLSVRIVVQKGRRIGFSRLMGGLHIWFTLVGMVREKRSKAWNIYSASGDQSKDIYEPSVDMIRFQPFLFKSLRMEKNGVPCMGKTSLIFESPDGRLKGTIQALSSGGKTKRGKSPDGQTFDEAAFVTDEDYDALDVSSMSGEDHQILGGTPWDDKGFFYEILNPYDLESLREKGVDYRKWYIPLIDLNDEGRALVDRGQSYKIKPPMITRIRGFDITMESIMKRVRKYNIIQFRREILGEFVPMSELFYPRVLVEPCLADITMVDLDAIVLHNPMTIWVGVDFAQCADRTAVFAFAEYASGVLEPVYWVDWGKMDYEDQYDEIVHICNQFAKKCSYVELSCDAQGPQGGNRDSLARKFGMCEGISFSIANKQNLADRMFTLMMQHRLKIPNEPIEISRQIIDVRANLKGGGDHLGDWVAAIWCALHKVEITLDSTDIDYEDSVENRAEHTLHGAATSSQLHSGMGGAESASAMKW